MAVNESVMVKILEKLLQTLKDDDELLNIMVANIEDKLSKETIKIYIDNVINELYNQEIDNTRIYSVKVYESDGKTVKISLDLAGKTKLDFDYEYADKENTAVITILDVESSNGLTITLKRTIADVSENLSCIIDLIQDSQIVGELSLTSNLLNSQTSYEIKNKINLNYAIINCNLQANTKVNFKDVTVDDLNETNCLFLDTLDEENFNIVIEAIKEKTDEVIEQKLNEASLVGSDNYSTFIEQPQSPVVNEEEAKEAAKQKIIDSVSAAMGQAISEGKTYTLSDLQGLEIPDSECSISLNDDIAIINIDGFVFTLDSQFNLSN